MYNNIFLVLVFLLSLTGCVSVVDSKMVHDVPLVNAKEYTLKTSNFKSLTSRFDQSFGSYTVNKTYKSWISNNDVKTVDSKTETITVKSDVIDWLVFNSPYPYDYSYKIESTTYAVTHSNSFGFEIHLAQKSLDVDCGNFSLNHQQSKTRYSEGQYSSANEADAKRVKTFLSCRLTNPAETGSSIFSIEILPDGQYKTEFTNKMNKFSLSSNHNFVETLSDGSKRYSEDLPGWLQRTVGFSIKSSQKQVASISLMNKPRIWIENSDNLETSLYATAISYSLFIFNDIDSGWQK